ncbi:hypothetical protein FM103_08010 [Corynebacterium xerosis]|nr:hypothetical protein FM103_08010 [Corynebacterium xerosis]
MQLSQMRRRACGPLGGFWRCRHQHGSIVQEACRNRKPLRGLWITPQKLPNVHRIFHRGRSGTPATHLRISPGETFPPQLVDPAGTQ